MNRKLIVVVDDEEQILETVKMILESEDDLEVETFNNVTEGLAFIQANLDRINTVISDIRMPIEDGFHLLKKLREISQDKPSIIMCSGFMEYKESELIDKGANYFFAKPIDYEKLIEVIGATN